MTREADPRPNILLLMGDHATWSSLGDRSPARTPNLDRLAAEGLSFERSYTPVSVCCPARAMLTTGSYPWHNGIFNQVHVPQSMNPDMRPDVVTYAQRLSDAGYRCGYVGKWHASHVRGPLDLGYDDYRGAPSSTPYVQRYELPEDEIYQPGEQQLSNAKMSQWPGSEPFLFYATDDGPPAATRAHFLASRASGMIAEYAAAGAGEPWLIETHFPEPHDPYEPLREFLDHYSIDDVELPRSYYLETFTGKPGMHSREGGLWSHLSEAEFKEARRHFYAYTEQLDHCVGKVLAALDESGQADNTLVVFGSDHGDLVGAHRMFIKGWMPYEESHRIPMVARWPGVIEPGATTSALVQLHDWAHTFITAAGAKPLPRAGGKDLTPILRNPASPGPDCILNVYYGGEFLYTQRILITQRYKYVFNGFDHDEFYDLERDHDELHNLIEHPAYEQQIRGAREQLWQRMHDLEDPYAQGNRYGAPRYLESP